MSLRTILFIVCLLVAPSLSPAIDSPPDPANLKAPVLFEEMETHLKELASKHDEMSLTREATSSGGRAIYLVKLSHGKSKDPWKVLAIGAQHGNEHSGKDALLYIIDEIAKNPDLLPEDTELYIVPMANPDGVNKNQRRNGNNKDLNRDHILLLQSEVLAIHRIQQRVRAHLTVDCHEFPRDSGIFTRNGLKRWPLMTMGSLNNPYLDYTVMELANARIRDAYTMFEEAGIPFMEYYLGGPPPDRELRLSTPETKDARNGLGAYGNLSFIIEGGIYRANEDPQSDFGPRVAAYRMLLWQLFLEGNREAERKAIEAVRASDAPEYLPTNYFWGTTLRQNPVFEYPALDAATGAKVIIPTANFMNELVIKQFVARPTSYVIPVEDSRLYAELLDRHAIPYKKLTDTKEMMAEKTELLSVEKNRDQVYMRYGGRQIMKRHPAESLSFPKGSLVVSTQGADGRRAALLLEPNQLYGLYQYTTYAKTANSDGIVPVYRIVE